MLIIVFLNLWWYVFKLSAFPQAKSYIPTKLYNQLIFRTMSAAVLNGETQLEKDEDEEQHAIITLQEKVQIGPFK